MTEVPKPTERCDFRVCLLLCEEEGEKKAPFLSSFLPPHCLHIKTFHHFILFHRENIKPSSKSPFLPLASLSFS